MEGREGTRVGKRQGLNCVRGAVLGHLLSSYNKPEQYECPNMSMFPSMSDMEILSVSNVNQLKLFFTAQPLKSSPKNKYPTNATKVLGWVLLDSGASLCFINRKIVQEHHLETRKKDKPKKLRVIDGREISSGIVDSECDLELVIGNHVEKV
jgi:hypothetical protein